MVVAVAGHCLLLVLPLADVDGLVLLLLLVGVAVLSVLYSDRSSSSGGIVA